MKAIIRNLSAGAAMFGAMAAGMTAASAETLKVAAISGYFSQGFGIAIVDGLKKAEKDGDISQDDLRRDSDRVQKMTDDVISEVDRLLGEKEKEIMHV